MSTSAVTKLMKSYQRCHWSLILQQLTRSLYLDMQGTLHISDAQSPPHLATKTDPAQLFLSSFTSKWFWCFYFTGTQNKLVKVNLWGSSRLPKLKKDRFLFAAVDNHQWMPGPPHGVHIDTCKHHLWSKARVEKKETTELLPPMVKHGEGVNQISYKCCKVEAQNFVC